MSPTKKRRGSMADAVSKMRALREGEGGEPDTTPAPEDAPPPKRRITVYLSSHLYGQARAATIDIGARGDEPASISALLDGALERELSRLARRYRAGESWPQHLGRLPGGRPPK